MKYQVRLRTMAVVDAVFEVEALNKTLAGANARLQSTLNEKEFSINLIDHSRTVVLEIQEAKETRI